MATAPAELKKLLKWQPFRNYHNDPPARKIVDFDKQLRRFLDSTMDEVRTSISGRLANHILGTIGISDAGLFRLAVLRRELTGNIAYDRQRDHSSHTIYNYLLGWYFYRHCTSLKDALIGEFNKRGADKVVTNDWYFGSVWQYVSLLHDIGYMFEGGLKSLEFRESRLQANLGSDVAHEYFDREFWLEHGLEVEFVREKLFKELGDALRPPRFDHHKSLGEISNQLRFVGADLEVLGNLVLAECKKHSLSADRAPSLQGFTGDAFDLWIHHYERFDSVAMANRVRSLRAIFNGLIDKGLPGLGIRLLDHGICSGLLQLLVSTYYYRLCAAAQHASDPKSETAKHFSGLDGSPTFWWTAIVWGTAAAAVHNVQQQRDLTQLDPTWPGKLKIEEDPLAYLGVVTDALEEWDRYFVFKALDREPVQGNEVELDHDKGKVLIRFVGPEGKKHAQKRCDELDGALENWTAFLEVR